MKAQLTAALLAFPLAACGPLLFADVEERRVCFERTEFAPAAPPVGVQTVTFQSSMDLEDGIPGIGEDGVSGDVRVLSVKVTGTTSLAGVTDADFIAQAPPEPPTTLASYTQPAVVADPNVLPLDGSGDANLLDFLEGSTLTYQISLTGSPPTTAWSADVETCLSVNVTVDFLEASK